MNICGKDIVFSSINSIEYVPPSTNGGKEPYLKIVYSDGAIDCFLGWANALEAWSKLYPLITNQYFNSEE